MAERLTDEELEWLGALGGIREESTHCQIVTKARQEILDLRWELDHADECASKLRRERDELRESLAEIASYIGEQIRKHS